MKKECDRLCENCGRQIPDNSGFCIYCGKAISDTDLNDESRYGSEKQERPFEPNRAHL